jgi:hypothetical protein
MLSEEMGHDPKPIGGKKERGLRRIDKTDQSLPNTKL